MQSGLKLYLRFQVPGCGNAIWLWYWVKKEWIFPNIKHLMLVRLISYFLAKNFLLYGAISHKGIVSFDFPQSLNFTDCIPSSYSFAVQSKLFYI